MKRTHYLWTLLAVVALTTSCATTHKSVSANCSRTSDTTSTARIDTISVHEEQKNVYSLTQTDSAQTEVMNKETSDHDETITERITETTDSIGNKTTVTDRTIHRKGMTLKQTSTTENKWYQQEQTALMLSMLDSIANSKKVTYNTHWAAKDSTYQVQTKDNTSTMTWWDKLRLHIGWVFTFIIASAIAWWAWKTK